MSSAWLAIIDIWEWIKLLFWFSLPFIIPIWIFAWRHMLGKYPIEAIIFEARGYNLIKTNDYMGRVDKGGIANYAFKKSKDTVPIVNLEWVIHAVPKPTNILERFINMLRGTQGTVFLLKYGSKQYKPIIVSGNPHPRTKLVEIKDKEGKPVIMTVYEQFDPRAAVNAVNFEVIDWDNMNFMVQEQRSKIERWSEKKGWAQQYLIPGLIIGAAVLVFIFASYFATEIYKFGASSKPTITTQTEPTKIPIIGDLMP